VKQAELESVWQYAQEELDLELAMEKQAELDSVWKLKRDCLVWVLLKTMTFSLVSLELDLDLPMESLSN
jgi:hypothetical protein